MAFKIYILFKINHRYDESALEQNKIEENKSDIKKKKLPLTFPWWTKIIAYILSFVIMSLSIFFIIIKGIEFGDEKVFKWLTSLIVSIFTSIFLTQPVQVTNFKLFLDS